MLVGKARQALQKYEHQLVIGNILTTRRHEVVFVSSCDQHWIKIEQAEIDSGVEIESKIVIRLKELHQEFQSK